MDNELEKELEAYLKERNVGETSLEANSIREGAEWGIEKQKAIDDYHFLGIRKMILDKACEWFGKALERTNKAMIDSGWKGILFDEKACVYHFRDAMEE